MTINAWIPDCDQRAALNIALINDGIETGFWDDLGRPAPWPDDIHEWRLSPATRSPRQANSTSSQDPLEDQRLHHAQGLDRPGRQGERLRSGSRVAVLGQPTLPLGGHSAGEEDSTGHH